MSRKILIIAGAAAVAGALVIVAIVLSTGGGGGKSQSASASPTPARQADIAPTQAPTQAAAPTLTAVPPTQAPPPPPPPPAPTALPDRTNCNEIRGTEYRSATEEAFFRANCLGGPAPTARPATGAPPPAAANTGPSADAEAEATYRSRASAQLAYFGAQLRQWVDATSGLQGLASVQQAGSIVTNFINALDGLPQPPPRFKAVHDDLRASLVDFRTQIVAGLNVKTQAQFDAWAPALLSSADRADQAISRYNAVVGINIPRLR